MKGVIAGCGFFARFHAEAWTRIPDCTITACADPDPDRAAAFARDFSIPAVYTDVATMLDAERPGFLDIATRPDSHLPLTRLAAAAGIPVICQKPMAPSLDDSRAMVEACRAANTRLVIHENWRWQPWYRELRRLLDTGAAGRVFHLGVFMRTGDGRGPAPYPTQPYFRDMPRLLVYESFVHYLDTFRYLAGEISSVYCRTARINPVIAGEDCALIHVTFSSGAAGVIDGNRITGPIPAPVAFGALRVEGESGVIRVSPHGHIWINDKPHVFDAPRTGYKGDSVKAMQEHFLACLTSGAPAESEGADYLNTVALVEACYESAGERVVSLHHA